MEPRKDQERTIKANRFSLHASAEELKLANATPKERKEKEGGGGEKSKKNKLKNEWAYKDIGGILSSHVHDRADPARVSVYKASYIIYPIVKHNPTIFSGVVCCHLGFKCGGVKGCF